MDSASGIIFHKQPVTSYTNLSISEILTVDHMDWNLPWLKYIQPDLQFVSSRNKRSLVRPGEAANVWNDIYLLCVHLSPVQVAFSFSSRSKTWCLSSHEYKFSVS